MQVCGDGALVHCGCIVEVHREGGPVVRQIFLHYEPVGPCVVHEVLLSTP